jgi:tRNA(Ile)-lysidine synthase
VLVAELTPSAFDLPNLFKSLNGLQRLVLAVSGGSDSMAMLRMVHEWARAEQVLVLTVDHGLRAASADEATQVKRWCVALGLRHETLVWKNDQPVTGVQAKARQARYDLMCAWCAAYDVPALLTAHTADDQAETVFMREARTNSPKSLAGIWPERDWNGVRVLRPLLGLRRSELRSFLEARGQEWIDDPSNEDTRFERVRARNALGGQVHGLVHRAVAAQAEVREAAVVAGDWCDQHLNIHETGFATFKRTAFDGVNAEVQDDILNRIVGLCGSGQVVDRRERLGLLGWLTRAEGSRRALGGVIFAKRKHEILAGREPGRILKLSSTIPESGEIVWDGRFHVSGPVGAKVVAAGSLAHFPRRKDIPAFVQAGLPVVLLNGCVINQGVYCKNIRH